jgi:hypothetical protein
VQIRQAEVEHHHVRFGFPGRTQRRGAILGDDHLEATGGQVDPQRPGDVRLVVDNQHRAHCAASVLGR